MMLYHFNSSCQSFGRLQACQYRENRLTTSLPFSDIFRPGSHAKHIIKHDDVSLSTAFPSFLFWEQSHRRHPEFSSRTNILPNFPSHLPGNTIDELPKILEKSFCSMEAKSKKELFAVFDQLRTNSITLCPFQDRGRSLKEGRDF
jgi:hypothetical protein